MDLGFYIFFPATAWLAVEMIGRDRTARAKRERDDAHLLMRSHDVLRDDQATLLTKPGLLKRRIDLLDEGENLNYSGRGDHRGVF